MDKEGKKEKPFVPLNDFFDSHGFKNGELSNGCNERWALFLRDAAIRCLRENMVKLNIGVAEHIVGRTKNRVRLWFHTSHNGQMINFLPSEAYQKLPGNHLPSKFSEAFRASCQAWQASWDSLMLDWKEKEEITHASLEEIRRQKNKETQT